MGQPYPTHEEFQKIRAEAERFLGDMSIQPIYDCVKCGRETILRCQVESIEGSQYHWVITEIAYLCTKKDCHHWEAVWTSP